MSLPQKNVKRYLEIETTEQGFFIVAKKNDADVLVALFRQHGISCRREPDIQPNEDALEFPDGVEWAHVERVLDGYCSANGS